MNNSHDEIKKFLGLSRKMLSTKESLIESLDIKKQYGLLIEEEDGNSVIQKINVGKSIEKNISDDEKKEEAKEELTAEYTISGGLLIIHGNNKKELVLTEDEKLAFQETMDEFVKEVSNMVDFNPLNMYKKNVIWSGLLRKENLIFTYNLNDGVFFETETMLKLDQELIETQNKLEKYFLKLESKWAEIIGNRIKTKNVNDDSSNSLRNKKYETFINQKPRGTLS